MTPPETRQTYGIIDRLNSLLPEKKSAAVTPEYRADGSVVLRGEVDGKQVRYHSHEKFTETRELRPLGAKIAGVPTGTVWEREHTGASLTIRNGQTVRRIIKGESGTNIVYAKTPAGTVEVISDGGHLVVEGLTPEAGKRFFDASRREFRRITRKIGVKKYEKEARKRALPQ